MIYHLFEYLKDYDIPGQGLFTYLSFRAMLTSVTAMLISFFAGRRIIRWLQKKQIGETIRDLGLEGQMQKKAFSINALVDCLNRFLLGLILPL